MGDSIFVYIIGFIAQFFFSARTVFQWIKSEKAKAVVSPSAYWVLSVIGAYLLCLYGWMRDDFSIILGQFLSCYIYLWNLNSKGLWQKFGPVLKTFLIVVPVAALFFMMKDYDNFVNSFFRNEEVPFWLLLFGSSGQIIFTLRFVYQWIYSIRRHQSFLPAGFWIISLIGSGTIIAYGIFRHDPVLILGQSFGFVAYCRNLIIGFRSHKADTLKTVSTNR